MSDIIKFEKATVVPTGAAIVANTVYFVKTVNGLTVAVADSTGTLVETITSGDYATTADVATAVQNLIGGAPAAYDTLQEIHAQLVADETAAAALVNTVASKAPLASPTFSGTVSDANGKIRAVPANARTAAYTLAVGDNGRCVNITTGGVSVPSAVFAAGDTVLVYNQSGTAQTITCSAVTAYLAGTAAAKTSLTLAARGVASMWFASASEVVMTGNLT